MCHLTVLIYVNGLVLFQLILTGQSNTLNFVFNLNKYFCIYTRRENYLIEIKIKLKKYIGLTC